MLRILFLVALAMSWNAANFSTPASAKERVYDVVIYGGTAGGAAAAMQVSRMGKSVVLIEPGKHIGGLTSGGLGATDIGNKAAIGGISREFYQRLKTYYAHDDAWRQERRQDYRSGRRTDKVTDAMWTFEPRVAEKILREMLQEAGVAIVFGERLQREQGVRKHGAKITAIHMESGRTFRAACFIDATYEGDLLAAAGVSYHVGREANSVYGETLNGVQTRNAIYHQMMDKVDPYLKPGEPKSGLLPGVHAGGPGEEGSGDRRVQAYCFRMCVTDVQENQIPFAKPQGYDPLRYELLLRNFEAGETRIPWSPTLMPNRKTDTNNNFGFSTDNINMNYAWAEGDYATRKKIYQEHLLYQQGLMWTLANHPRVPQKIREAVSRWGLAKDEFVDNGGWSHQLYVREGRRMVSDYVMTQHNCQGRAVAKASVALGAYGMDSHNVQRYVDQNGYARNEGDVQVHGFAPYPISYLSIVPRRSECENLLAPLCLSASHIAFGSIRMEPVFMVLGQSAATAACIAIDSRAAVQDIEYAQLEKRLRADKQVLVWTGPRPQPRTMLDPEKLPGVVLEDGDATRIGNWIRSQSSSVFVGPSYWHDGNVNQGESKFVFAKKLPRAGVYEVRVSYAPHGNRATNALVIVEHAGGRTEKRINQRVQPPLEKIWIGLGEFSFSAERPAVVIISNAGANGYVIADAVQFLPVQDIQ